MASNLVASLLLVAMPGAPSSFLLLVVRPGAPSSDGLQPSSDLHFFIFQKLAGLSTGRMLMFCRTKQSDRAT